VTTPAEPTPVGPTRIGPTRLVVIRCGKYDYGEIDLTAPVHLVGPNNVGKTSLIALLQLLYVDDQRHMAFSRPLDESKRYYFPDTGSWVLFETLTPTGFQVVGAHGLGKVRRNDFERFVYQGRFDAQDFLDPDRRVRDHDDVRARLAPRGYALLEPRHLQAALTGLGESRGVHLGLVPLRDRDQYRRFRTLFQHLLRLAQIRQTELKALLLEIYRGRFRQPEIELGKEVAEQLRIVRKNQEEVRRLRDLQPTVEHLLAAVSARDQARAPLPALWRTLGQAATDREASLAANLQALDRETHDLAGREAEQRSTLERLEAERTDVIRQATRVDDALARLEAGRARFRGFVHEFKAEELATLDDRIAALDGRLHSGHAETAADVAARLERLRRRHAALAERLATLSESVGAHLGDLLPDPDARAAVFKLLNAGLLQLRRGRDGLEVTDEAALRRWLDALQQGIADHAFAGHGVRIDLAALPAPDLAEYLDADRIAAERDATARDVARLEEVARAMAEADALRAERADLRQRRDGLVEEIAAWRAFQADLEDEPRLRRDLAALDQRQSELATATDAARTALAEIQARRREITHERAQFEQQQDALRATLHDLTAPDPAWTDLATAAGADTAPPAASSAAPLAFDDLAARYRRGHLDQQRHHERVQDQLQLIEDRTYGAYAGRDEAAVIDRLRAEMAALPEKEAGTDQLWRALTVGLRSAFKAIWQDLDTLKARVTSLNRHLAQVAVSNLQQVRLVIQERPEWGQRIRDMLDTEDMPLFADPEKSAAAVAEIASLLDQHEKVQLSDLFGLQFEVTTVGGRTLHYQNLDVVESNGTTITMKVLINVLLLRELLSRDDVRIPYYLDEASSLDQDNLAAIVNHSRDRGFVPVLASPDPMEAAAHLYFVAERDGRVVLDPELSRVTLRVRGEGEAPDERGPAASPEAPA
jgi:hypothetical protein